jgi:26S proteasome regulatory subunit N8
LSTVDHYYRVAKDTKKRVVGILLGTISKGQIDVTNSYAVPFEEDEKNPHIWFLDHNYHEHMWAMFKKVNARERVIGWYSTGPKIRPNDIEIHQLLKRYTPNPAFVIIDVQPTEAGIPTKAYVTVDEVEEENLSLAQAQNERFVHIPSVIGALEAEEVGVEHLLRDVKDTNVSTMATQINDKVLSLQSLTHRLFEMHTYLENVLKERLPVNHVILNQMQEIFNLLPNLNEDQLVKSFMVKTNDMLLVTYLASLSRSIVALHNLINNKLDYRSAENALEEGEKKEKKDDKEAADKKKEEPVAAKK